MEVFLSFSLRYFSNFNFEFSFLMDFYSLCFFRFVVLITSVVFFYRNFYISGDKSINRFVILVLLFVFSIGILIMSPSFIGVMLG